MEFAVPAEYRIKLKENEKLDKYLDSTRELKNLWKMKMTVIPETRKRILRELDIQGRIETLQTTALLKSTRILRRVSGYLKKKVIKNKINK